MYSVINHDGSQHQAVSVEVLAQWAQQGHINAETRLFNTDSNQIIRSRDLPQLLPYFHHAAAPVAQHAVQQHAVQQHAAQQHAAQQHAAQAGIKHPKCLVCGYIGPFKNPPFIYTHDLIISIVLFCLFGAGLIWFTIACLKPKQKSCPNCKSTGMFTLNY